jgi:hypothetical protein
MTHKKNRPALTWTFIGLLAATAVLGGCASVETRPTAATNASNPLIAQAGHLAREHAGLSGAARSDN